MSDNASTDTGAGLAEREVKPRDIRFAKGREGTGIYGTIGPAKNKACRLTFVRFRIGSVPSMTPSGN